MSAQIFTFPGRPKAPSTTENRKEPKLRTDSPIARENRKVETASKTLLDESARDYARAPLRRPPNAELRSREYLTPDEVEALTKAARGIGRHRHRDATLVLIAYRHGLRVSELIALKWDHVDLQQGRIHVSRLKKGSDGVHPISGPELRALRQLKRDYPGSSYLFVSERGGPMTASNVRMMVRRAGESAGIAHCHPHMLRHACGYKLANDGTDTRTLQAYLGHKNIQHTVVYTQLSADRFNGLWKD